MLSGDNGLLTRATESKERNERAQIIENAKMDILAKQSEKLTDSITEEELAKILQPKYGILSDEENILKRTLTSTSGKYTIKVSEIYNGTITVDNSNKWVYDHETQTVTKGNLTFEIGDYIKYDAPESTGYTGTKKWRVLGEENGKLLLVSTDLVYSETTKGQQYPMTSVVGDSSGFDNAIKTLNDIGALYINEDMAENARSINLEDVNKITGYNPRQSYINSSNLSEKGPAYKGQLYQYGNIVTYTLKNDKVWYKGSQISVSETESTVSSFKDLGSTENITGAIPVESTAFQYYAETLGDFAISEVGETERSKLKGLDLNSKEYDVLFNKFGSSMPHYLLATPYATTLEGIVYGGLCRINNGKVEAYTFLGNNGVSSLWMSPIGMNGSSQRWCTCCSYIKG